MALIEYKCQRCAESQLIFDGEEKERFQDGNCGGFMKWCHNWRKMPPNPVIVHTTDTWMSEPSIDSFQSLYELDRILNIEEVERKEMELVNRARREL